jgi:hypothetical protein
MPMKTMKLRVASTSSLTVILFFVATSVILMLSFADAADDSKDGGCGTPPCRGGCYLKADSLSNNDGDFCTLAPAGHYSPDSNNALYRCLAGTFASKKGSETCMACPVGTAASKMGSRTCDPCDEGLYSSQAGWVRCKMCNPAVYFGPGSVGVVRRNGIDYCMEPSPVKPSSLDCGVSNVPCSGGCYVVGNATISNTKNSTRLCSIVPQGFYSPEGDDLLYKCSAGTYASEGSRECALCEPGSATGIAGSGFCQLCPPSTYASDRGTVSCYSCNSMLYSGPGSETIFYDDQNGVSYCLDPTETISQYPIRSPSMAPTTIIYVPSEEPSKHKPFEGPSEVPSTKPTTAPDIQWPTTNFPTTIFDLVSERTRPPQDSRAPQPFGSNSSAFDDSGQSNSGNREYWKYFPLVLVAILIALLTFLFHRRYRWRHISRQPLRIIPSSPQQQCDRITIASLSPPPIPTEITTRKSDRYDDEMSLSGLFLEEDSIKI